MSQMPLRDPPAPDPEPTHKSTSKKGKRADAPHSAAVTIVTAVLPLVASVAAVIIALLSYVDQHNANQLNEISAEQEYAAKVSFWQYYSASPLVTVHAPKSLAPFSTVVESTISHYGLVIANRASTPVANVRLLVYVQRYEGRDLATMGINVGTLPPCSTAHIAISRAADRILNTIASSAYSGTSRINLKGPSWVFGVRSMTFTDSIGITWMRRENGSLTRYTGRVASAPLSIEDPAKNDVVPIPGCS